MTKTLYDPAVERRGIEKGIEQAIRLMLKKGMDVEIVAETLEVDVDTVSKIKDIISRESN